MAEAYFDRRGAEFFAVTKQVAIQGRSLNSVKNGRHTMQQRFCECGHSVLVAYVITKKGILQLAVDMVMGTAPRGFGHEYAAVDYIDAWFALAEPEGWTEAELERLRRLFTYSKKI
jgi:hypothetical protein